MIFFFIVLREMYQEGFFVIILKRKCLQYLIWSIWFCFCLYFFSLSHSASYSNSSSFPSSSIFEVLLLSPFSFSLHWKLQKLISIKVLEYKRYVLYQGFAYWKPCSKRAYLRVVCFIFPYCNLYIYSFFI